MNHDGKGYASQFQELYNSVISQAVNTRFQNHTSSKSQIKSLVHKE